MSSLIRRRQRKPDGFYIGLIVVIVTLILSGLAYFMWAKAVPPAAIPAVAMAQPTGGTAGSLWWPQWKEVLGQGVPGLFRVTQPPPAVKVTPELSAGQVFRSAVRAITGVDVQDMRSLLHHTHTSESFIPTSGQSHSPGGQRGDIVKVGDDLAKYLEQKGIGTVHSDNIHDYPSFMRAYNLSEVTVKKMLSDNPSLQMVFDIHRDAEKRENVTAMVNGVAVARILIVVAVGQPDLVQPHWQQNHAFAKLIEAKLNERYPGLSRGIKMDDWRYNQHLHPRALLLEVGCQENSLEEANRSMEMLGEVLVDIINENKEP